VLFVGCFLALAAVGVLGAVAVRSCDADSLPARTTAPSGTVPSFFRKDARVTCFSNGLTEAINIGMAKWSGVLHWERASGAQIGAAQRIDASSGGLSSPRGAARAVLDAQITDGGETQTLRLTATCK